MTTCTDSLAGRMPVIFANHGGGPMPLLQGSDPATRSHLESISLLLGAASPPSAILVVSAHWEASPLRVSSAQAPAMLYDYSGFPPESYEYQYSAPGSPALATQVQTLLASSNQPNLANVSLDPTRGFDHGVFVPLMLAYPQAKVPVVCLSLHASLDAATHFAMGRALQPLRHQGVLILGSGFSFHNMQAFDLSGQGRRGVQGQEFENALVEAVLSTGDDSKDSLSNAREAALVNWAQMPGARQAHPREEHLLPLLVCAGAAGDDAARAIDRGVLYGVAKTAFVFGSSS